VKEDKRTKTDAISIDAPVVEFEALSISEESERRRLEEIVEQSFVEAGRALKRLRDGKYYRSTHSTFSDYARERFGFERRHPYRLIEAAEVVDNLTKIPLPFNKNEDQSNQMCPIGTQILPTAERLVRPLTNLEPEQQRKVWLTAVSEAGNKVPPARVVKSVVDRIREKNPVPNPWRRSEVAEILVKENPDLRGRGGCWAIVTEVHCSFLLLYRADVGHRVSCQN
jgi:hypothetical protein